MLDREVFLLPVVFSKSPFANVFGRFSVFLTKEVNSYI